MFRKDHIHMRILMCVAGVIVCGISVGFFKLAAFGVDPFQSFMAGLDALIPIPFGTLYVIANILLLSFSLFADRHMIGLGTIINLFLVGYAVQFSYGLLHRIFPAPTVTGRILSLLIGIVIICFSSAMYFTADLGVSTYDAVALILSETWKLGYFRFIRIATDLVCVVTGVSLYLISGGTFSGIPAIAGIGTIITAFFMGPLIDFFKRHVSEPLLQRSRF